MKTLKVAICFLDESDNVVSRRFVNKDWSINDEFREPKEHFIDEIGNLLFEATKINMKEEMFLEMVKEYFET